MLDCLFVLCLNYKGEPCNTAVLPLHTSAAFKHQNSLATNIFTFLVLQFVVSPVFPCKLRRCSVHSYVFAYDTLTWSCDGVLLFYFARAVTFLFLCISLSQLSSTRNLLSQSTWNSTKPLCNRNSSTQDPVLWAPGQMQSWSLFNWLLLQNKSVFFSFF